jgi:hypothetical protein
MKRTEKRAGKFSFINKRTSCFPQFRRGNSGSQAIVVLTRRSHDGIARGRKGSRKGEMNVKKLILASLIAAVGTVGVFAAQAPKAASTPASKTAVTKKHKKHHKKATAANTNAKPAASK